MPANESSSVDQREKDPSTQYGEACSTPPSPNWSEPEKWIWQQVCEGKIADFNQRYGELDPKIPDGWSETREITPSFLEAILTRKPYESVLHRQGVRIIGAFIRQPIDLENGSLDHQWWLEGSRILADVKLTQLRSTGSISFERSVFLGSLMFALGTVGGQLSIDGAQFQNINLRAAKIKNHLSMVGATCTGTLDMDSLEVDGSLFMREGAQFKDVILRGAVIKGQLSMVGATCTGTLNMDSLEVGSSLLMREGAQFEQKVSLVFADIGGSLSISGAKFNSLDMTETRIRGELYFGSGADPEPVWQTGSQLILRNAVLGTIQAPPDLNAWPDKLDLYGCTYTHLGGMTTQSEGQGIVSLEPGQLAELLKRDVSYSPQPYQQLAGVLRSMGHPEKADTVLYEGKERERGEKWSRKHISKWLGLSLLKWTIGYGYGYRYFRSLVWAFVFIIFGALVVSTTVISKDWNPVKMLGFSFDLLLPIVKLDENHSKIFSDITGWQYYYFYVHKLVGYILALFVGAGLSGITKK